MKIAICIPTRDMVHAGFAFDLANLVGTFTASGMGSINILTQTGTLIADQRVDLANAALTQGAEYLLWLDSDMRFPKNTLSRLLARNKDIVGCNYSERMVPPRPTAHNAVGNGEFEKVWTHPDSTGLEKVGFLGFGCILIKAEVFKKMEKPWFHLGYSTRNHKFIGEDVYFCIQADKAGFDINLDHDLSKEIAHIGSFEFRHEHTYIVADERAE